MIKSFKSSSRYLALLEQDNLLIKCALHIMVEVRLGTSTIKLIILLVRTASYKNVFFHHL